MTPFTYVEASTVEQALQAFGDAEAGEAHAGAAEGDTRWIAGGTNLIDLMKENVTRPLRLIDLNGLALRGIEPTAGGGLMLGALARNAATAYDDNVRRRYPLLSAALLAGASPQIRNMATNGGNLLQRTRCVYFYDVATPCNKRQPGAGCAAIGGFTRQHAILGASDRCIATHPSDMCVALAALEAVVHVQSRQGRRTIAFADFHRLPGERPEQDNTLQHGDIVTHIELPPAAEYEAHSAYLKVRERASYAFALVSVAAALDLDGQGLVRSARIALGGVAHKPWRLPEAETVLAGKAPTPEHFEAAAEVLLRGAQSQGDNAFKLVMARRAIVRALETATSGTVAHAKDPNDGPGRPDLKD
jgi:xanthine dehydrogenase YagS FAD-binding subunit